jgi:hypothetical protein
VYHNIDYIIKIASHKLFLTKWLNIILIYCTYNVFLRGDSLVINMIYSWRNPTTIIPKKIQIKIQLQSKLQNISKKLIRHQFKLIQLFTLLLVLIKT